MTKRSERKQANRASGNRLKEKDSREACQMTVNHDALFEQHPANRNSKKTKTRNSELDGSNKIKKRNVKVYLCVTSHFF